jgi:hypothetical protein
MQCNRLPNCVRDPGVQRGELTNASAAVLVLSGPNYPGSFPLIAFARATVTEKMQANADLTNPSTQMLMTFFAAQGYAVVATDFLGYVESSRRRRENSMWSRQLTWPDRTTFREP